MHAFQIAGINGFEGLVEAQGLTQLQVQVAHFRVAVAVGINSDFVGAANAQAFH